MLEDNENILFNLQTPLGFNIRTTRGYWDKICIKHPDMKDRLEKVMKTLVSPNEVRKSKRDNNVLLFYNNEDDKWIVAVSKRLNGEGFLITAYRTDSIKEGDVVWHK